MDELGNGVFPIKIRRRSREFIDFQSPPLQWGRMILPPRRLVSKAQKGPFAGRYTPFQPPLVIEPRRQINNPVRINDLRNGSICSLGRVINLQLCKSSLRSPVFKSERLLSLVPLECRESQKRNVPVITPHLLTRNVISLIYFRITRHIALNTQSRFRNFEFFVQLNRPVDPLFGPNHLLHRIVGGNPGATARRPPGTITDAHLQAETFRLRYGIPKQIPPGIAHVSNRSRRGALGDIAESKATKTSLFHGFKVAGDSRPRYMAIHPMPPCVRFGGIGRNAESSLQGVKFSCLQAACRRDANCQNSAEKHTAKGSSGHGCVCCDSSLPRGAERFA